MNDPFGRPITDPKQHRSASTRIVIVGGGAAGIEAALALRYFGGSQADIEIFSPRNDFEIRPLAVWEALGHGEILRFDLESLAHGSGVTFSNRGVSSVEAGDQQVVLHDGTKVPYDYLVVAIGTKSLWVIPGAKTFWGPNSEDAVREITDLIDSAGTSRIILTMPDLTAWQLPVYELALYLTAIPRDAAASPVKITIASPETVPLGSFGDQASRRVAAMLAESQVEFLSETVPVAFGNGSLTTKSGDSLKADAVINLPSLTGHRLGGLEYNENGFIEVDHFGQIEGLDRIYAAGDVTDYPVKFGSLATGQADVVAASIAAHAWGKPEPEPFQPRLSGILMTVDGPVALDSWGDETDRPSPDQETWDPSRKIYGRFLSPLLASMRHQP